jgi:hypothetical protein
MLHAILSSQLHMIFMPPVHFSILIVQRGTIIMLGAMAGVPMAGVFIAGIPMFAIPEFRSIIIALVITRLLCWTGRGAPAIRHRILFTHNWVYKEINMKLSANIASSLMSKSGCIRSSLSDS